LNRQHCAQNTAKEGELCSTSLRVNYLHKSFGVPNRGLIFFLIYLFSHLFMSIWTHGCLFYTLDYNPIILYFLAQIILALDIGKLF
jgi:hypothetical protein